MLRALSPFLPEGNLAILFSSALFLRCLIGKRAVSRCSKMLRARSPFLRKVTLQSNLFQLCFTVFNREACCFKMFLDATCTVPVPAEGNLAI